MTTDLGVTGYAAASERAHPALNVIDFFKTRSALVVAAVATLDEMPAELARLKAAFTIPAASNASEMLHRLEDLVHRAAIGSDNLLVANPASVLEPFVMCSVSRQPSGAVDVRTIELDRDALALAGAACGKTPRPFEALVDAVKTLQVRRTLEQIGAISAAIDAVSAQVRASVSRLSILKARLDLQQSFLSSVMEADSGSPSVRLDSHLNQAGARDMALEARRLLSSGSLNIANGNRKTLTSLFERHTAAGLPTLDRQADEGVAAKAD